MPRWKNVLKTNDEIYRLKRDAVLRESCRIFSKRGFHNVSLDDVARALNVSKGTLYNYVEDKQEILFECHKMALDIGERAFKFAEATSATGADALHLVLRRYIATLIDELGACGIITEIDALKPADRKEIVARRDKLEKQFVRLIREGIGNGSLRKVDEKIAIFAFMGALHNVPIWYSPDGRLSGAEIADRMSDVLIHGMAAAPSAPSA